MVSLLVVFAATVLAALRLTVMYAAQLQSLTRRSSKATSITICVSLCPTVCILQDRSFSASEGGQKVRASMNLSQHSLWSMHDTYCFSRCERTSMILMRNNLH